MSKKKTKPKPKPVGLPPSVYDRLSRFCAERPIPWAIGATAAVAIEYWLDRQGAK